MDWKVILNYRNLESCEPTVDRYEIHKMQEKTYGVVITISLNLSHAQYNNGHLHN